MKTKELVEVVKQGARPIIKIIEHTTDEWPDIGLIGRIMGLGKRYTFVGRKKSGFLETPGLEID